MLSDIAFRQEVAYPLTRHSAHLKSSLGDVGGIKLDKRRSQQAQVLGDEKG
jgi:hypothetical protein